MKKIIFIDHTPFVGGAQLVLAEHISNINKQDYECIVICSNQTPSLVEKYQKAGAKVHIIEFGQLKVFNPVALWRFSKTYRDLKKILTAEKPDLVVTNTVRAHIVGTIVAKDLNIPVIWIIRDYTFSKKLFTLLHRYAAKVLTVSKDLVSYYGLTINANTHVIYVGSDVAEYVSKVRSTDVAKLKDELGITEKSFVVGFVGRLVSWKGAQVIVRAVRELTQSNPDIVAVIVGDGKGQDDSNEEEVKSLAKGYEKNIILTGFRKPEEIPTFLSMFDVFVHPSLEPEPFATVVVSAMMAKKPVIGTSIGGTPELITDHKNGLLVEPDSHEKLRKAILELYTDGKLRKMIAESGYLSVYPHLTEKEVTKKVIKYYNEVIG